MHHNWGSCCLLTCETFEAKIIQGWLKKHSFKNWNLMQVVGLDENVVSHSFSYTPWPTIGAEKRTSGHVTPQLAPINSPWATFGLFVVRFKKKCDRWLTEPNNPLSSFVKVRVCKSHLCKHWYRDIADHPIYCAALATWLEVVWWWRGESRRQSDVRWRSARRNGGWRWERVDLSRALISWSVHGFCFIRFTSGCLWLRKHE